ncbi:hypothetical protein HK101_001396 [Irineochytrium annulatum]|nr:hypothetical protein HK101_001396 [Irineochytrium annulatum]
MDDGADTRPPPDLKQPTDQERLPDDVSATQQAAAQIDPPGDVSSAAPPDLEREPTKVEPTLERALSAKESQSSTVEALPSSLERTLSTGEHSTSPERQSSLSRTPSFADRPSSRPSTTAEHPPSRPKTPVRHSTLARRPTSKLARVESVDPEDLYNPHNNVIISIANDPDAIPPTLTCLTSIPSLTGLDLPEPTAVEALAPRTPKLLRNKNLLSDPSLHRHGTIPNMPSPPSHLLMTNSSESSFAISSSANSRALTVVTHSNTVGTRLSRVVSIVASKSTSERSAESGTLPNPLTRSPSSVKGGGGAGVTDAAEEGGAEDGLAVGSRRHTTLGRGRPSLATSGASGSLKRKSTVQKAIRVFQNNLKVNPSPQTGFIDWGIYAMLANVIQGVALGVMESYILWCVWKFGNVSWGSLNGSAPFILVYLALFILAQAFLALGIVDAAWNKNAMQVLAGVGFNIAMFVYSLIQMDQIQKFRNCGSTFLDVYQSGNLTVLADTSANSYTLISLNNPKLQFDLASPLCPWSLNATIEHQLQIGLGFINGAVPWEIAIVVVCGVGNLVGAFFAWKVYQGMLSRYHFFILLLKLNIFFTVGIVAQMVSAFFYIRKATADRNAILRQPYTINDLTMSPLVDDPLIDKQPNLVEYAVPSAFLVVVVAALYYALGFFGVRRASYPLMICFKAVMIVDAIAVIIVVYIVFTQPQYQLTKVTVFTFSIIQLLLSVVTLVAAAMCALDFRQGLRALRE